MKNIYFISDLHLSEQQPEITRCFLDFLEKYAASAKAIYILGDFFDTWIGDDDSNLFISEIIAALKKASLKTQIFLMRGNRDFLLGEKFATMSGCELLKDEKVIEIAGVLYLLMHGDTLCTADKAYMRFRFITHLFFVQKLFLSLPLPKRLSFAKRARLNSANYTGQKDLQVLDVTQASVIKVMKKHKVQHLIHGHTHKPATHEFINTGSPCTRTVLGAWHGEAYILQYDIEGNKAVIIIKPKKP